MMVIGRPASVGTRFNTFSASGVKRRMQRSFPRTTMSHTRHLEHMKAGLARHRLEVAAGGAAELNDLEVNLHDHAGGRILGERDAVGFALSVGLGQPGLWRRDFTAASESLRTAERERA